MQASLDVSGSYVLVVRIRRATSIEVGHLGLIGFPMAYYAYVGSAMGGLKRRLRRHVSAKKAPKWHIDYVLIEGHIVSIALFESRSRLECSIAQALKQELHLIKGFGCSDCLCPSHLFFAPRSDEIMAAIVAAGVAVGVKPKVLRGDDITNYLGIR